MAVFFSNDRQDDATEDHRSMFALDQIPEEILVPITSGAFVRGIAETLELLSVPAVFLDSGAHVLFANKTADAVLTGSLRVRAHHLVAEGREDRRILSDLIGASLTDLDGGMRSAALPQAGLRLHLLPVGDCAATQGQMLAAVVLIDRGTDPCLTAMIERMGAMSSSAADASAKP